MSTMSGLTQKEIKDRICNKGFAKLLAIIDQIKNLENALENGDPSLSNEQLEQLIQFQRREYDVWSEIMRLNECE